MPYNSGAWSQSSLSSYSSSLPPKPSAESYIRKYKKTIKESTEPAAAEKRAEYQKGYGLYSQLAEQFKPGGGYMQGTRSRTLAAARQGSIGTGMYGSTRPAALSTDIERQIEESRAGQYAGVLGQQAEYAGKYQPIFPSSESIASLLSSLYQGELSTYQQQPYTISSGSDYWGSYDVLYNPKTGSYQQMRSGQGRSPSFG